MSRRAERRAPAKPAPAWLLSVLLAVALVGGVASDLVGPSGRISILAPPVLALIAWNAVVYGVLLVRAWRPEQSPGWAGRLFGAGAEGAAPALTARVGMAFHLCAAVFAMAMLASLYARGLAFEYRAGWDSTFLGAPDVHAVLSAVLGPASAISGIGLPDAAALERLRFTQGPGENAARWIHLYALTVLAVVVLPRLLLAGRAAVAAARSSRRPAAPAAAGRIGVTVLPYGYAAAAQRRAALESALAARLGGPVDLRLADNLPLGGEDNLDRAASLPADDGPLVLLFPLTATPERENHGAFVRAVRTRWPRRRLLAWVDGSGFRARLDPAVAAQRVAQRSEAWRQALAEPGGNATEFLVVDLAPMGAGDHG